MAKTIYEIHEFRCKGKYVVRHGTFDEMVNAIEYIEKYIAPRKCKIVDLISGKVTNYKD